MKRCILCDAEVDSAPELHVCLHRYRNGKKIIKWHSSTVEAAAKKPTSHTKFTKLELLQLAAMRAEGKLSWKKI